jgi:hypothetical protein
MPVTSASCAPSGLKREVPEQASQVPCARSQKVGQVGVHGDEIAQLGVGKAQGAVFVQRQADGDGQLALRFLARLLDHLAQEAGAVFKAAAIFVAALVGGATEEVLQDAKAMRAVKADDVEARGPGAAEGLAIPAAQVADALAVHRAGLHGVGGEGQDRAARRRAAPRGCRGWGR